MKCTLRIMLLIICLAQASFGSNQAAEERALAADICVLPAGFHLGSELVITETR